MMPFHTHPSNPEVTALNPTSQNAGDNSAAGAVDQRATIDQPSEIQELRKLILAMGNQLTQVTTQLTRLDGRFSNLEERVEINSMVQRATMAPWNGLPFGTQVVPRGNSVAGDYQDVQLRRPFR